MLIVAFIVIAVLSYLLGSLNFGVILSNHFKNDDVRNHGSGNAGTTNMLRSYGKGIAFL
ncbi:MAG: glycerol-3-phosphate acyltransferase, partial [Eubacterium sp.]